MMKKQAWLGWWCVGLMLAGSLGCKQKSAEEAAFQPGKRPDPARFAKEIAGFDKQDAEKPPVPGGIVFTGSSSIRLWKLDQAFGDLPVLNRGFGGSVANDLIVYADKVALRYQPKILVIYTGSNDINAKLTVEESLADFTGFLEVVHAKLPATKVIINPVKISRKRIEQIEKVHQLNDKLKAWSAERPWTRWVDSLAYLADDKGQPIDSFFAKDQLHLSPEGYAEWEKILGPVLREEWAKVGGGS